MKDYLTLLILINLSKHSISWRDSYNTKNNVEPKPGRFTDSSDDDCWNYNNHHFESSESRNDDFRDRIIFPDTEIDFQKNDRPTHTATSNPLRDLLSCIRRCNTVPEFDPVCGTDDITYYNLDQLQCAAQCGVDVHLQQLSKCPMLEEATTKSPLITRTDQLRSCMWSCPTTHEYNPVCGTDNVTYNNLGKLTCAQYCGVDVQLKRHSPCPKFKTSTEPMFTTTVRTTASTTIQLSRETLACIDSCPATSEYSPVCGSNGKTYFNVGKLECAIYCGVDVTLVKRVPCSSPVPETNEEHELTTTTTTQKIPTISQDILDQIFNHRDDYNIDVRRN